MKETELSSLITSFTVQFVSLIENATAERIRAALAGAFGAERRGPGRPPKVPVAALAAPAVTRAKRRKQLCPVPGCKNPAAPVFGMVCAKHKDVPKAKIKEYRAQRRAAKMKKAA
jgi:hypothetical protein